MTHDYKRNGTTTLFAALNVLDGTVTGKNMQRHRHQEFIRFLNELERDMHEVVIACGAEVIARHPRSYEREDFVFNPLH